MKSVYNHLLILLISLLVLFTSCKKYDEQTFNFTPSVDPYVSLKSYATKTVVQSNSFSFILLVRTAIQEPVIVTYEITGDFNLRGTYTLQRNTLEGTVSVVIPAGTVPSGSNSVTGSLKLTSATRTNGKITIGRISSDTEKFSVIVKP